MKFGKTVKIRHFGLGNELKKGYILISDEPNCRLMLY